MGKSATWVQRRSIIHNNLALFLENKRPQKQMRGSFNFLSFCSAPEMVLGANDRTSKKLSKLHWEAVAAGVPGVSDLRRC